MNSKITWNKTKYILAENEFKKLQRFDWNLFIDQNYFNHDEAQLYLKFQSIYKTITTFSGLPNITSG